MGGSSGISGMSIILTLSLISLIVVECLKKNNIENYTEINTDKKQSEINTDKKQSVKILNEDIKKEKLHSGQVWSDNFLETEIDMFEDIWIDKVNNSKPTIEQLNSIGGTPSSVSTMFKQYNEDEDVVTNDSNDRSKNIGLCAQNFNTFGISTLGQPAMNGVSSSLLPQSAQGDKSTLKGFEDCNNKNILASQFLLTDTQIGIDTTSGRKIGQSYDLRSAPANPHDYVGIWGLSTKYENLGRRPLEDLTILNKDDKTALFNKLDTNKNGEISLDEFLQNSNKD